MQNGCFEKIWWIKFEQEIEGPYSSYELKKDRRITPDTLVRANGETVWRRIRDVKELNVIFEDEEEEGRDNGLDSSVPSVPAGNEMVLTMGDEPPSLSPWLIIAAVIILYFIFTIVW